MKLIKTSLTYQTKNFKIDIDSNGKRTLFIRPKRETYMSIYQERLWVDEEAINELIEALHEAKEHFKHV